jgi:putative mRNA 3-end processing factor
VKDLIVLSARGLYCEAGDFYIDPWKPVPVALITHAHGDHAHSGSQAYWAQEDCLPILRLRLGREIDVRGFPYGETIVRNGIKISFHPAGHILGSSQIRVERGEGASREVWVFTGDYKRDPDPSCKPFEVVECDTLITEATFALPIYHWKPGNLVAEEILTWWKQNKERGWNSILCCYALGKTQRILAELANLIDQPVHLHGSMKNLVQIYRDAGIKMCDTRPAIQDVSKAGNKEKLKGALIIAPPSASGSTWTRRFEPYEVGFASGWMQVRGNRRRKAYDRGFVVSDHADWNSLLRTIEDSKAKRVIATHGSSEVLARYVNERMGLQGEVFQTEFDAGSDDVENLSLIQ